MNKLISVIIIIITLLCIYSIGYIELDWFWHIGVSENYYKINKVILNLSYSYLAGLIFYVLTSYCPYIVKRNKMRVTISEKIKRIIGRLNESAKSVFPIQEYNNLNLTEDNLVQQFSSVSISMHCNNTYAYCVYKMSVLNYLKSQRDNIIKIIDGILVYKEYLSANQLKTIEHIKDSNYFVLLNAFSLPISGIDNASNREELAKELFEVIQQTKKLLKTLEI
jgi:hypothetical protein